MFLMNYLVKAIYKGTKLVLVGDIDQLPSVGPGSVLKDIIESGQVHTITLNQIFRQAAKSKIIVNAHRVNEGESFIGGKVKETKIDEENIKDEKLVVKMKIHYTGTAAGVLKGGFMVKHLPEIRLSTVIGSLPESIVVDVSALNIGDELCVKDLNLGKDVTILSDKDASLVSISPAR